MHKLTKDRVLFIKAMISSAKKFKCDDCGCDKNFVFTHLNDIINQIRENKNNHFLSVSQEAPMQVSYCRKVEDKYNTTSRVRLPFGRYIVRNLDYDKNVITDSVLNKFVSNTWAIFSGKTIAIQELTGEQIMRAYRLFSSTDAHSCMTGDSSNYTQLYALNPDKVSLLVFEQIRALLWKMDDGTVVLDRCYPSGHCKIAVLREWAKSKGYILRINPDRLEDSDVIKLSDNKIHTVTLKKGKYFPYLDTFCYGNFSGNNVVLSNSNEDMNLVFHNTDGSYIDNERGYCEICEGNFRPSRLVEFRGMTVCEECRAERVVYCSECDCEMDTEEDNICEVDGDYLCEDCFNENYLYCFQCGEPTHNDNAVENESNNEYYCEHCAERRLTQCDNCGVYVSNSDATEIDGSNYCENCVETCPKCNENPMFKNDLMCTDCKEEEEEEKEERERAENQNIVTLSCVD